ncbi:type VI secretion system-associated FHA domain protein TagH [Rhodoblastus acidophilus]|uniref:Type VI secretion system-associated FHA domain protein TagH n=1 Tax=Candidatus Rhodoblastus alkanivorans TaxID=2954117 RepID=A0ABS9Z8L0_9HYPH|nr:type VI secretion system-associated FHA domain protein TagH [Candidatus Rhodoblastus alkanivorans]MCI4678279.1 type VI secretion system-associated FHA domain protein TagH [Candidatus Rhodoblastus alkanivorans]MCI4683537.1 type VI secretion system-associated FHA domain protein TagH [Candidatus Rhodoblastus alkanivorans]MDI4640852.1 type VI secretion system-associated FHA domain protein TagH [Rhodoblastus acidophilus]
MPLKLSIDNFDRLSDGGPLTFTMRGQNRAEIGRDAHLDWRLPDPERIVSGKHCEITREGDDYYLVDLSTNGTYVNGSSSRVQSPYRLKGGDQLQIGDYLISVVVTPDADMASAEPPQPPPAVDRPASYDSLWDAEADVAPPEDPRQFRRAARNQPIYSDFLYHAADAPRVTEPEQFSPRPGGDFAATPPREDPLRAPAPRRPRIEEAVWDEAPPVVTPSVAPDAEAKAPAPPPAAPEPTRAAQRAPFPEAAILDTFARAAGLPEGFFAGRDPNEVADMLGRSMRVVTEEMKRLLQARAQAKNLARSSKHTVIEPRDNNPLKFTPTPEDALRIMFAPPSPSYLGAERALAQGFADLGRHQAQCFSAMQQAVRRMFADLDPANVEAANPAPAGVAALVKSHKSALWDAYVAAWRATAKGGAEDVIQRFMLLFGQNYDKSG